MKRIAFYGGTFDPVHNGHLAIGRALVEQFTLDRFVFIPAFHAPHKRRIKPTSGYDRFAMICLMTQDEDGLQVSKLELELPERPYSVETLARLIEQYPNDQLFFVMGADSWMDIRAWRKWEKVLLMTNHIVVTRPGIEIASGHVTQVIRRRIVDLRESLDATKIVNGTGATEMRIYFTDTVNMDVSASSIRNSICDGDPLWTNDVPPAVANYIQKYQIYS
jgi:nicotinate-nucleotide adenylyltransferase